MYSYHAPILIISQPVIAKTKRSFKFENWWLAENDFQVTAQAACSNTSDKPFHRCTSKVASSLKRWSRSKRPLQRQLDSIHAKLMVVQSTPFHLQDHNKEASIIDQHDKTMSKLTEFYTQRAKRHWVIHGDKNTTYFHNAMLKRRRKNRVSGILDSNNNWLYNPDDIASCFINYFSDLFATSHANLANLHSLEMQNRDALSFPSILDK